jgi:hypothetical protein
LFQQIDVLQHLLLQPDDRGVRLAETAILLGEAAEGSAQIHAQRAHAVAAGVAPGKHSGMIAVLSAGSGRPFLAYSAAIISKTPPSSARASSRVGISA